VCTGPNWTCTPLIAVAGLMNWATSNWMSGSSVAATAGRFGIQARPSSSVASAAAEPASELFAD
jgi:hypothetical protein